MKKTTTEFDQIVEGWLKEDKQKRMSGVVCTDCKHDFMDLMLSILVDVEELPSYDFDTIIKAAYPGPPTGQRPPLRRLSQTFSIFTLFVGVGDLGRFGDGHFVFVGVGD
ncbi:putative Cytochrome P450 [Melia azedarach]|uniref:Cytochrome P450 n=1 Tax=Melia azedarach TaxID=155640 RepID=A0ACC1XAX4_MELAZ|nr:putative Cytochrome P450 [Melia azedarach]